MAVKRINHREAKASPESHHYSNSIRSHQQKRTVNLDLVYVRLIVTIYLLSVALSTYTSSIRQ